MSALEAIREGWENAARDDALFNILTTPGKENGGWDPEEFFQRGVEEVDAMLLRLSELGLWSKRRRRALDFGCGVGRLTQALAATYMSVDGVDISVEMVRQARRFNRHPGKVRYTLVRGNRLEFPNGDFDLIYSCITLQHMPQSLQRDYVGEFIRILHHTGRAVFHLPEGPELHHPQEHLSMYGTTPRTVKRWVTEAGGEVLDVERTDFSGDGFVGWRYTTGVRR